MPRKFSQLAFTPAVKAIQEQRGSRAGYARMEQTGAANDTVTPDIAAFIASMEGFYLGTVNANGYPYIQFRGGYPGFLKVLGDKTLGFADFRGNIQYISVGNLSENDKAFLFLMDYRHRRRLKLLGRARYVEGDRGLIERLRMPEDDSEIERAILFEIEAWDWNCPQHIPLRYSETEVNEMIAPLQDRIAELEQQVSEQNR